jgi:hypothetical protein
LWPPPLCGAACIPRAGLRCITAAVLVFVNYYSRRRRQARSVYDTVYFLPHF